MLRRFVWSLQGTDCAGRARTYLKQNLFLSRMIRLPGRGPNLPETKEKRVIHEGPRRTTKGHEGVEVNRDGMPRSRRDGRLLIVSLLYDPPGTAGAGLADKREFPKGRPSAFREFAHRIPPTAPSRRHPRERGHPDRILSLGLSLSFPAMRHPATLPAGIAWARPKQSHGVVAVRSGSRRWVRLYQDLCGRDARAPGGLSPLTS